jgi:methionyl-tRNA synthetase
MPPVLKSLFVTSALPYANGSIHIGHMVEYIQTDIFVRYHRLRENDILYCCGDDAHGTPIMLKAREAGVTPEQWVEKYHAEHKADFARFSISFDNYGTTNSPLNRDLSNLVYEKVKASGAISRKTIEQLYDPKAQQFLPDRFVKGTCPNCKSPDQYGDSCAVCGKTFDPSDLINPVSVISGATPILKQSEHLFLELEPSRNYLSGLYAEGFVEDSVRRKLEDWFKEPLRPWDISRDAPFFGFPIPGEAGKYFYNWFDAPIGYLASLGERIGEDADGVLRYWNDLDREIFHFIGKDIQYFHALFWPVMLKLAGLRPPTQLTVHGFLTVNGKKMSKRDGTFIRASTYADHCDASWLRYYYATKLGPGPEDVDLSLEDFINRVNSELVGKLANLISRGQLLQKAGTGLEGRIGVPAMDALPLLQEIRAAEEELADAYEHRNTAHVTRVICALADKANKYVEDQAPWALAKQGQTEDARGVLTAAIEAGRLLTIYLKPIVPAFAHRVEKFLGTAPLLWKHIQDAIEPRTLGAFERIVDRIDPKQVNAMIDASKEESAAAKAQEAAAQEEAAEVQGGGIIEAAPGSVPAKGTETGSSAAPTTGDPRAENAEPLAPIINFDQFTAIDLRVAKVLTATPVEKSDKLMKLTLDVGALGERTILAGIKKAYTPEKLVGRLIIFCANLAPRTMGKFGTSEGMILASGPGGADVFVLSPDTGAKPGERVH